MFEPAAILSMRLGESFVEHSGVGSERRNLPLRCKHHRARLCNSLFPYSHKFPSLYTGCWNRDGSQYRDLANGHCCHSCTTNRPAIPRPGTFGCAEIPSRAPNKRSSIWSHETLSRHPSIFCRHRRGFCGSPDCGSWPHHSVGRRISSLAKLRASFRSRCTRPVNRTGLHRNTRRSGRSEERYSIPHYLVCGSVHARALSSCLLTQ